MLPELVEPFANACWAGRGGAAHGPEGPAFDGRTHGGKALANHGGWLFCKGRIDVMSGGGDLLRRHAQRVGAVLLRLPEQPRASVLAQPAEPATDTCRAGVGAARGVREALALEGGTDSDEPFVGPRRWISLEGGFDLLLEGGDWLRDGANRTALVGPGARQKSSGPVSVELEAPALDGSCMDLRGAGGGNIGQTGENGSDGGKALAQAGVRVGRQARPGSRFAARRHLESREQEAGAPGPVVADKGGASATAESLNPTAQAFVGDLGKCGSGGEALAFDDGANGGETLSQTRWRVASKGHIDVVPGSGDRVGAHAQPIELSGTDGIAQQRCPSLPLRLVEPARNAWLAGSSGACSGGGAVAGEDRADRDEALANPGTGFGAQLSVDLALGDGPGFRDI